MSTLSNGQISDLCLKLATLLHAGLSVGQSTQLLKPDDKDVRDVVKAISDGDERGERLYESMEATGRFPAYVTGLIRTGDESGKTEEALFSLSDYYNRQALRAAQVRSALLYPAVLMLLMLSVIVVLLTRVLPVFDSVYASLGGAMTGLAGTLVAIGSWLDAMMPVLFGVLLAVVLFMALFAGCAPFRSVFVGTYKSRFGDRGVSRKLTDAKLAQALAMGLQSGLPLEHAMRLAAKLAADVPAASRRCSECARLLESDVPLDEALGASGILPPSSCELLALGQRGGSADTVMDEIAGRLAQEADDALDRLISRIEPAIVLSTSLLVGMILMSVMLPLMDIMTAIG